MINQLLSNDNIRAINEKALELTALLNTHKFFFVTKLTTKDERVKASCELFVLLDALKDNKFKTVRVDEPQALSLLKECTQQLYDLLNNERRFTLAKINIYTKAIKPKLCRELLGDLEDAYILGDITLTDITDIYNTLNKPLPKKFQTPALSEHANIVYAAINKAIRDKAQTIRIKSIQHYQKMVTLIDPENTYQTPKTFFIEGKKRIADLNTLRLCLACKFEPENFLTLIDENFNYCILYATNKIMEHYHSDQKPTVEIENITLGGKGFDIRLQLNYKPLYVRAITIDGCYVRFHYRYIIT